MFKEISELNFFNSLISGFAGAVIGGLLALLGSLIASRKQSELINKKEMLLRTDMIIGVIAELADNLHLAREATIRIPTKFATDLWDNYKGVIFSEVTDFKIKNVIRESYSITKRLNSIADRVIHDHNTEGRLEDIYGKEKEKLKTKLMETLVSWSSSKEGKQLLKELPFMKKRFEEEGIDPEQKVEIVLEN